MHTFSADGRLTKAKNLATRGNHHPYSRPGLSDNPKALSEKLKYSPNNYHRGRIRVPIACRNHHVSGKMTFKRAKRIFIPTDYPCGNGGGRPFLLQQRIKTTFFTSNTQSPVDLHRHFSKKIPIKNRKIKFADSLVLIDRVHLLRKDTFGRK